MTNHVVLMYIVNKNMWNQNRFDISFLFNILVDNMSTKLPTGIKALKQRKSRSRVQYYKNLAWV